MIVKQSDKLDNLLVIFGYLVWVSEYIMGALESRYNRRSGEFNPIFSFGVFKSKYAAAAAAPGLRSRPNFSPRSCL